MSVKLCSATGMDYFDDGSGHKRYLASKPSNGKMQALPGYRASGQPIFDQKDWVPVSRRGMGTVFDTIFDQGSHGSCVGNGWAGAAGRVRALAGMSPVVLSPGWFYSLINGNSDNGAVISDGIEAGQKTGFCTYSTVGEDPIYQSQMPATAAAEAAKFRLGAIYQPEDWASAISAILTGRFIAVYGYMVGNSFENFDQYGVAGHARGPGNHCVRPDVIISGEVMQEAQTVKVGEKVYGHDGKLHEVKKVFRRYYNGNLVRIGGAAGVNIEVTEEHPVLVYRWARVNAAVAVGAVHGSPGIPATKFKERRHEAHWIKAKDVRPGDYLVTPKIERHDDGDSEQQKWDFFVGYFAGNGSLIVEKNRGLKGVHVDLPLDGPIEAIASMLGKFGKVTEIWRGASGAIVSKQEATSLRLRLSSKDFASKMLDLVGRRSSMKNLPVMSAAAFSGLLAADGHSTNGRTVFNTVSRVLAQQVRLLAISLGFRPTMQSIRGDYEGKFANGKTSWRVSWSEVQKQGASRFAGSNLITPVRSVMFVPYSGDVYNFEVADVNSYLADTVATHNCNHADGIVNLPDGRWVFDDVNSWGGTWGPFSNGRIYIDENHLFGGGDQPDICVIEAAVETPGEPNEPPVFSE
jgi:hypothetical protein